MKKKIGLLILGGNVFVLCSCIRNSNSEKYVEYLMPDSSVNKFILRDTSFTCSIDNFPPIVDTYNNGEGVYFSNASSTEYLFLKMENGGYRGQFDYFYITDTIPLQYKDSLLVLPDTAFYTTRGARLGLSEKVFSEKYKDVEFEITRKDSQVVYSLDTLTYHSRYVFVHDSLRHIEFGEVY